MEYLTLKQQQDFCLADTCQICEKASGIDDVINRDHCHFA